MVKTYIVGGVANDAIKELLTPMKEIEILSTFSTVTQLANDIIQHGVSFLHMADSILIVDYGFSSDDYRERAKEFVIIQDALSLSDLRNIKLYLVTKDSNLYSALQKGEDGLPSIIYINAEVFLIRSEYAPKILSGVLQGSHDKTGLYHPDVDKLNKISRMEEDRDVFIEESKTVKKEILHYGKDEPISPFSQQDYIDSPYHQDLKDKKEQEKRKQEIAEKTKQRQEQNQKPKQKKKQSSNQTEHPVPSIDFQVRKPLQTVDTAHLSNEQQKIEVQPIISKSVNIERMKEKFQDKTNQWLSPQKLAQDKGILFFTGVSKSGTSGVTSNVAEMYALMKRKVLIIDLDIDNRMQTIYYPQYHQQALNQEGTLNSLIQVLKGGSVKQNAISITSRIHILGVGRKEKLQNEWHEVMEQRLPTILNEAKVTYDLILVDIPFYLLPICSNFISSIQKIIFTTTNKFYELEGLFQQMLPQLKMQVTEQIFIQFVKKLSIWINQYEHRFVDLSGYVVNRVWVHRQLRNIGYPYDLIQVIGETPYYENWENQFYRKTRYVRLDSLALKVYQQLMTKVVW